MPTRNPIVPCPRECGLDYPSNLLSRHVRGCLGANPTIEDLCRVGGVETGDGCWTWRGSFREGDPTQYGTLPVSARARYGGERYAHRLALLLDGRPPGELSALHTCDNPPCIRPDHLYVGTRHDNMRDAIERGGWRGGFHVLTPEQQEKWRTWRTATTVPREERTCPVCGTTFLVRPKSLQRACSKKCGGKAGRKKHA